MQTTKDAEDTEGLLEQDQKMQTAEDTEEEKELVFNGSMTRWPDDSIFYSMTQFSTLCEAHPAEIVNNPD